MSIDINTLKSISTQILGAPCIPKDITLWEHYVNKGGFSINDFREFLYKLPEFRQKWLVAFTKKCRDLNLGDAVDVDVAFGQFWNNRQGTFDDNEIEGLLNTFIFQLPGCKEVVANMIQKAFSFESNVSASDAQIDFYLEKCGNDFNYNFIALSKDIVNGAHLMLLLDGDKNNNNSNEAVPTIEQLNTSIEQTNTKKNTALPFNLEFIDEFEAVYQRPMFVQEYFKHVDMRNDASIDVLKLHSEHNFKYNRMREIFETYTGKTISEYYYVHKFLFLVDDENFFVGIVDDIVASGEYKRGMTKVLVDKYASMFDAPLSEMDADYIFEIVRAQKLDIVSDTLASILTSLKEETDKIIGAIFKIYNLVLERPPDMNEIEQYVSHYRNGWVDANLEKVLMRTLEFHDNIKKMIKAEHGSTMPLLPSVLYDILNRVLIKLADLDMGNIRETIRTFMD